MPDQVRLQVKGQDSLQATPALYSNFLAVARVGGEVQFEFIFLDLNQLAVLMNAAKTTKATEQVDLVGKTVAKIVMPAANVVQLKEHLLGMFAEIEKDMKSLSEVDNVRSRASS